MGEKEKKEVGKKVESQKESAKTSKVRVNKEKVDEIEIKNTKTKKNTGSRKTKPKEPKPKEPKPKESKPKESKPKEPKAKENIDKLIESTVESEKKKQRDMNELVSVICITNNPLVYESKNQAGYRIDWDGYLQENWIEYKELINMRGSQRAFFEKPWIICDWDVLVDLKVDHYYKNIIDLENLDDVFKKSTEELEQTLKIVPKGIKDLIVDRAFELRRKKELDSLSVIETIEKTLNIDLSI